MIMLYGTRTAEAGLALSTAKDNPVWSPLCNSNLGWQLCTLGLTDLDLDGGIQRLAPTDDVLFCGTSTGPDSLFLSSSKSTPTLVRTKRLGIRPSPTERVSER